MNRIQYDAIARFCNSKIIVNNLVTQEFFNDFAKILTKVLDKSLDSDVDRIFKNYISYGNTTDSGKAITDVQKVIAFKQSSDLDITIIAKMIYSNSAGNYYKFVRWQLDVLLDYGQINIKNEYIRWLKSTGATDEIVDRYLAEKENWF